MNEIEETAAKKPSKTDSLITLFLGGDVMTGRGIDQVLPYAGDPTIHEPYLKSAREYAELSEEANGPIPQPVDFSYIWGDALDELELLSPDVRIINLETSITESDDYWKDKAIHYRMNPKNIPCITAARVDFCSLANNHILDWGYSGLTETLETLEKVNIKNAGAGRNLKEAATPAVMEVHGRGKVIVFSFGSGSSGIPLDWEASENKPGVNLLPDLSMQTVHYYKSQCYEKGMVGLDILVFFANWQSQFCRLLYRNTERGDLREIIKNYIWVFCKSNG